MGEPVSEAVDVAASMGSADLLTDEGRDILSAQLEAAIDSAKYEATMGESPIEPVLAATLSLRMRYLDTDPEVAAHFLRMAAMCARLPYTNRQADRLEQLIGSRGILDLAAACEELEGLAQDVADLQGFPTTWFNAWMDLSVAVGADAWPKR